MNTHLKQLWAAMKLPEKLQKSYKFFCRGLDIRVPKVMKADFRQVTVRNPPAKVVRHILGREQLAIRIDEHIVCVCGSVSAL